MPLRSIRSRRPQRAAPAWLYPRVHRGRRACLAQPLVAVPIQCSVHGFTDQARAAGQRSPRWSRPGRYMEGEERPEAVSLISKVSASGIRPVVVMGFAEAFAAIESAWSLRGAGFD